MLPIYDAIFQQNDIRHILVRHEQAAAHAAEGYARSTGKPGVVLVTSGPGATNAVTGMVDALMDSIPIGDPDRPGPDLHDRQRRLPGGRHRRHHPALHQAQLAGQGHRAARRDHPPGVPRRDERPARPGARRHPQGRPVRHRALRRAQRDPHVALPAAHQGRRAAILAAVEALERAERPILYSGGGVINSGPRRARLLRELVAATGFPITSTLMGLGAYPASGKAWMGMLGMHGTYEANWAMHDCDVMVCIGARFDDRITGRIDAFSPHSVKIHIDIDPSSINKNVHVDVPIVGDVGSVLEDMLALWKERGSRTNAGAVAKWWRQIELWRGKKCLTYRNSDKVIKPQYALERLEALTKRPRPLHHHRGRPAPDVGGAVPRLRRAPNRWMTSGGLGTMGYGFPASIGVQIAHPEALVINVAGEASWLMNMQEMGTAVQYRLPVKQFILNNERLGMVRQWQELLHGERYSSSWSESLPDFVKLAEAFGAKGDPVQRPRASSTTRSRDARPSGPGDLRLRGREARELLPDDPERQGAQRDAARRGRDPGRDRGRRRRAGVTRRPRARSSPPRCGAPRRMLAGRDRVGRAPRRRPDNSASAGPPSDRDRLNVRAVAAPVLW